MAAVISKRVVSRTPIVFQRPQTSLGQIPQACNKTKSAICFFCLFDGLRNPSIRRLVRKPRTVCQKPLLTFDPTYYAPGSKNHVQEIYNSTVQCSCDMSIDPSAQNVLQLLRKHATQMPPQRVLIHYFGHGCHPPTDDGSLYFFSEDRTRYKPIKILNILSSCPCPLCVIIDAPNAGCLSRFFSSKADVFAFFACGASESLPLSTDAPLDLFSSCLLTPYETALWFHRRHHTNVMERDDSAAVSSKEQIKKYLESILEAILFDSQIPAIYDKFAFDTSVFAITRGFVLAQRLLNSFNIHPSTYPELKSMSGHTLWGMWDTAIDCFLTMPYERANQTIYKIFSSSFNNFPSTSVFPIFAYYLRTEFHNEAVQLLLKYIDTTEGAASTVARSNIPKVIINLEKPSAAALVIVAKSIAAEKSTPFDPTVPLAFQGVKDPGVLKAAFLTLSLSTGISGSAQFSRMMAVAIEKASSCAPYSALFLGLVLERASKLMTIPEWISKFCPLLKSRRMDVRAAVCFLLGFAKEDEAIQFLVSMLDDENVVVRCQAVWSLVKQLNYKNINDKEIIEKLQKMAESETDQNVKKTILGLLPFLTDEVYKEQPLPQDTILVQRLTLNVNGNGFMDRFEGDAFLCDCNS